MRDVPNPGCRSRLRTWTVRALLATLLLAALAFFFAPQLIDLVAGHSRRTALHDPGALSPATRALIDAAFRGIDPALRRDLHAHVAGMGGESGCWVHPDMTSPLHPAQYLRFRSYLSAAGVKPGPRADRSYVENLAALASSQPYPGRHFLLAFDFRYTEAGEVDRARSTFHVPDEYVWSICAESSGRFLPAVSIHPYRADALAELRRWSERGARLVKWLPNAMGIDPASERCDEYYALMAELGMVLLSHTGEEQAVHAAQDQELGNPLRLRRPLDAGVKVIAAHCASSGESRDLDHGGEPRRNFELFLRMMGEERYVGRFFGEISTVTQVNRYAEALGVLLERTDLHPRLVDGSDWPLPAINALYPTPLLVRAGFLTGAESETLREVYHYNPLLFDFVLKRTVKSPTTGTRFPAGVFMVHAGLGL